MFFLQEKSVSLWMDERFDKDMVNLVLNENTVLLLESLASASFKVPLSNGRRYKSKCFGRLGQRLAR